MNASEDRQLDAEATAHQMDADYAREHKYSKVAHTLARLLVRIQDRIGMDPCPFSGDVRSEINRICEADEDCRTQINSARREIDSQKFDVLRRSGQ